MDTENLLLVMGDQKKKILEPIPADEAEALSERKCPDGKLTSHQP